ncbi:hypothetical protein U9M48_035817 [Paspalum notatum var. saurae]|uniref:Replication factor A C-terminal domain-containing protein n=1 Tax=Paspalum notatum var. saurae TaxID=547442 RepID=A0AAQ3UDE0_PASNO
MREPAAGARRGAAPAGGGVRALSPGSAPRGAPSPAPAAAAPFSAASSDAWVWGPAGGLSSATWGSYSVWAPTPFLAAAAAALTAAADACRGGPRPRRLPPPCRDLVRGRVRRPPPLAGVATVLRPRRTVVTVEWLGSGAYRAAVGHCVLSLSLHALAQGQWPLSHLPGLHAVLSLLFGRRPLVATAVPAMAFALLPSLHPRDRHAVIRVRVCRKWEFRAHGTDDGSIIHIDLVLADEKGNSMYAEIPTTEIERKGSLVQEGGIYVVSRFMVSNAKNTFMPVPGNYMIEFTYHTMVTPVTDTTLAIPELIYHLTPFGDLEQHAGVHSHFTDVLGVLIQVSDARAVHLTGRPNPTITRDIVLRDLSYFEIKVSLWGHRASAFTIDTIHNPSESKPIVVLLVGTVVKTFQGQHCLSAGAACRWFFNPPIPEADVFYNSLNDQRIEIRHSAVTVSEPRGPALAQAEITTLGQLDAMDTYTIGDACYRCTVVIARLVPGERWWFPSCARCNKSCMQETSGYKCRICLSTVYKFKYKLAFVATDGTAEAKMVSFDNVATRIIGKPVQQLMRAGRPTEDFPPDIAAVAQAIDSHQQQPALRGGTLEVSAETEMPKDTAEQQAAATLPETTFKMLGVQPQPSHDTPAASNGTPPDTNTAAHSAKKDLTKTSTEKNTRTSARRKLLLSEDEAAEKSTALPVGAKKQRGQKTSTPLRIREAPSQSQKSSTLDDDAIAADATSDTSLLYFIGMLQPLSMHRCLKPYIQDPKHKYRIRNGPT